jgi:hypothetical protein
MKRIILSIVTISSFAAAYNFASVQSVEDVNTTLQTATKEITLADKKLTITKVDGSTKDIALDAGFENVDNTSDLDKPISTATQTALDAITDTKVMVDININADKEIVITFSDGTTKTL